MLSSLGGSDVAVVAVVDGHLLHPSGKVRKVLTNLFQADDGDGSPCAICGCFVHVQECHHNGNQGGYEGLAMRLSGGPLLTADSDPARGVAVQLPTCLRCNRMVLSGLQALSTLTGSALLRLRDLSLDVYLPHEEQVLESARLLGSLLTALPLSPSDNSGAILLRLRLPRPRRTHGRLPHRRRQGW